MSDLTFNPRTGKWQGPDTPVCPAGHHPVPGRVTRGHEPCRLGGHRYWRCEQDGHSTEDSRYSYPPGHVACTGPRRMAPDGEMERD